MKLLLVPALAPAILALALLALPARAEEKPVALKEGPGKAIVEGNCGACHSLDYIPMNSRFADAKLWDAEVTKMIKAFGAPIEEGDGKAIVEYLVKNYGK
jgi:mono/diheme cytochrome c family protein